MQTPSHAAATYLVETDSNGDFQSTALGTASWTGTGATGGTVQNDVSTAAAIANGNNRDLLVDNFSGTQTLSLGNFSISCGAPLWFGTGTPQNAGFTWSMTMSVGSGTADLSVGNITSTNLPEDRFANIILHDLQGVSSLSFTANFGTPIAAARTGPSTPPYLGGIRSGGGHDVMVTTTMLNPILVTDGAGAGLDLTASQGLPAGADMITINNSEDSWGSGASSTWNITNTDFQGPNVVDLDGGGVSAPSVASGGNGVLDEIERVYATGIRFDITPEGGGNFSSDADFLFSFNGVHYEDSFASALTVPEPSTSVLLALACASVILRRKK